MLDHDESLRVVLSSMPGLFASWIHIVGPGSSQLHLTRRRCNIRKRFRLAARSRRGPRWSWKPLEVSAMFRRSHWWRRVSICVSWRPIPLHLWREMHPVGRASSSSSIPLVSWIPSRVGTGICSRVCPWISSLVHALMLLRRVRPSIGCVLGRDRGHPRRGVYTRRVRRCRGGS